MSYLPSSPTVSNIAVMLGKYPGRGILLFKLLENIRTSRSSFNKNMRELIITYTSGLNQCGLSYNTHKAISEQLGIEKKEFDQLKIDIEKAQVDEKLKPILRFVKKLTLTPDQINQTDAQRIYDAGWDEQALLDSIEICAIVNCVIRFVSGIGFDLDVPTKNYPLQLVRV